MKQGLGLGAALLIAVLFMVGCATQPNMVVVGDISNLPQTVLPGAELQHARALAMGRARSTGWTIREAAANRLLLERELERDSPLAVALGLDKSATAPRMQVETSLAERRDGTVVALRSFVVANPGTETEERIDRTGEYENELMISLSALETAWLENRERIASEVPLPARPATEAEAESALAEMDPSAPDAAPEGEATAAATTSDPAAGAAAVTASTDIAIRAPEPPTAPIPEMVPTEVAGAPPPSPANFESAASRLPAPSGDGLPAGTAPAIPAPPAATATGAGNDMLALNANARKGLWAYYAEDYARLRGCNLTELGAVLLQETPEYELHEVHCATGPNFLLRCQGGLCREMR